MAFHLQPPIAYPHPMPQTSLHIWITSSPINYLLPQPNTRRKTKMAMAMALRRLSSSIDKPLRPFFNATSLYYMVSSSLSFLLLLNFCNHFLFNPFFYWWVQSSLPNEAVYEKEKPGVTVKLLLKKKKKNSSFILCSFRLKILSLFHFNYYTVAKATECSTWNRWSWNCWHYRAWKSAPMEGTFLSKNFSISFPSNLYHVN